MAYSAVMCGLADMRKAFGDAERRLPQPTMLFLDEIHRFNRSQQDAFLPHLESGLITLVGATTQNPSFELVGALLSRVRVFVLEPLRDQDLRVLLERFLARSTPPSKIATKGKPATEGKPTTEGKSVPNKTAPSKNATGAKPVPSDATPSNPETEHTGKTQNPSQNSKQTTKQPFPPFSEKALAMLVASAEGDARQLFNNLETVLSANPKKVDETNLRSLLQTRLPRYDKAGDHHYNLASALHKSLRASDADAALYWAARMLSSGEDPQYLARRLLRFASEDVGLADPTALRVAVDAWEAWNRLGAPEGETAIAQAIIHLATAPKSNAAYKAWNEAMATAKASSVLPPPMHILNAPTELMKAQGFGKGYRYDHDYEGAFAGQDCFPKQLGRKSFYKPTQRGFERQIARRLEWWQSKRTKANKPSR